MRCALERIVASEVMRNAPQLVRFLRFVVEETLEGRAAELKGYTIATQALGRPDNFDPQIDPIVRVEAMRLRRALQAYYAGPGRADPVTIEIPRGTYEPDFSIDYEKLARSARVGAGKTSAHARYFSRNVMAAILTFCLLAMVFVTAQFNPVVSHPRQAVTMRAADLPTVVIEPMIVEIDASQDFSGRRFRLILSDALARFDEISVIDRRMMGSVTRPIGLENGVYSLFIFVSTSGTDLEVGVQLVRRPDGVILWSRQFVEPAQESGVFSPDPHSRLAARIAAIIAQPSGVLFADLRGGESLSPPSRCVLTVFNYWGKPSERLHAAAMECVERLILTRPDLGVTHALMALLYVDGHRMGYATRPEPVARALEAAERAVSLSPESARAHQALMAAQFAGGNTHAALKTGMRAAVLNPHDIEILAAIAAIMIVAGDHAAGAEIIRQARRISPAIHAQYDFHPFLAEYMQVDREAAARERPPGPATRYPSGLLARSSSAAEAEAEDRAIATKNLLALLAIEPGFGSGPGKALARRGLSPDVVAGLLAGLDRVR